jgi:UDP-N-acetylmuramoyl-L-alanyl-D-glutamate--2,6-diaminopimelate ligase
VPVRTRLPGRFNVANALLALAMAEAAGVDPVDGRRGIAELAGVPGRMERVEAGQPFTVLVDYAHTPDSVENVLRAARDLTDGRVIVVVGCGGDRDAEKRPLMGRAAAALSDLAVLTSDNPRSEDPVAILDAMATGAPRSPARATAWSSTGARGSPPRSRPPGPGTSSSSPGKGHETYQELASAASLRRPGGGARAPRGARAGGALRGGRHGEAR